jgi:hypothetical protein
MSHIYPLKGQKHVDLHAELTELGGEDAKTFRLAFAWDGEHFMEVTDDDPGVELYDKWIELHGGAPDATNSTDSGEKTPKSLSVENGAHTAAADSEREVPAGTTKPEIVIHPDSASSPDAVNEPHGDTTEHIDNPVTEPPESASTDESSAATEIPDVDDPEPTSESGSGSSKSGSSTSGTPRKRSAKNSTRRS